MGEMMYEVGEAISKPRRHNGIKCLDCKVLLARKTELRRHMGHEVVYLNADGSPDL